MRELTSHKVNGVNDGLTIYVTDDPGIGGANHTYEIVHDGTKAFQGAIPGPAFKVTVDFQNGPIREVGINGGTHEAYIAILIDRLEGFQRGKFACQSNAEALEGLQMALASLQLRTAARLARGVEGTHTV